VTNPVSDAVILMAGTGSRLRESGAPAKPLIKVLGRPLVSYTLEALAQAGVKNVHAVVGYASDAVMSETRPLAPRGMNLQFILNAQWEKQNGVSVLAAAGEVRPPFFLTMCDHFFDQDVFAILQGGAIPGKINLAVDRKVQAIFDIDDAMKVRTADDRVVAIGKTLEEFDAIDTGMFVCPDSIFAYLECARVNGDCSLADGIRAAAAEGNVRAVDIGNAWWQDVDTPEMLAQAEQHLLRRADLQGASASGSKPGQSGK
jgi:choline kinase